MEKVEIGKATLYLADCIEVLPEIPPIDSVITDPPFSSGARTDAGKSMRGAMLRAQKWDSEWFSHDNMATIGFLYLMRLLTAKLFKHCAASANAHFFIDWRMYPNLYGALESSGWIVKNMVVWNKKNFGMGSNYRNQHEIIIYAEKGDFKFPTSDCGNVINDTRIKAENHPTEKPVQLLGKIIKHAVNADAVIFDPFMGSGSTGVAAMNAGRNFVGCEIEPRYFEIACRRIEEAQRQEAFDFSRPLSVAGGA